MARNTRKQNPDWVHIADDEHDMLADKLAKYADRLIRQSAIRGGADRKKTKNDPLCPGCLSGLIHNAVVNLTLDNGHPMEKMAGILEEAFGRTRMKAMVMDGRDVGVEGLLGKLFGGLIRSGDEPEPKGSGYRAADETKH